MSNNQKTIGAIDQAIAALEAARAAHVRSLIKQPVSPVEPKFTTASLLDAIRDNARAFVSGVMENPLTKRLR